MKKRIFISYSHNDETWKDLLVKHLDVLEDQLEVWEDTRIQAGDQWKKEIDTAMTDANASHSFGFRRFPYFRFHKKCGSPRFIAASGKGKDEGISADPETLPVG